MKTFRIKSLQLHLAELALAALCLSLAAWSPWPAITGWLIIAPLLFLPGALVLQIVRLGRRFSLGELLTLAPIVSITLYMLLGLALNQILPFVQLTTRPLDQLPVMLGVATMLVGLGVGSWYTNRRRIYRFTAPRITPNRLALTLVLGSLPLLAAAGAISLNNHGPATLALLLYGLIAILPVSLLVLHRRIPQALWPWAVFCMALALLWSTSLRGWYITGHDIQLEYYVYRLTESAGHWAMWHFQDPYNACLSLTILPTLLKNLTAIDAVGLYKVVYQVIFALFTLSVYFLARRFTTPVVAFLSGVLFITFPTFTIDMPFLVRQELAFACFGGLMLILFTKRLTRTIRLTLLPLLGLGLVLSHYSTTFATILLFAGAWTAMRLWKIIGRRWDKGVRRQIVPVPLWLVIGLMATTLLWSGAITKTSSNVTKAVDTVVGFASNGFHGRTADDNSGYSPIGLPKPNPQQQLDQYVAVQRVKLAAVASTTGGFETSANRYQLIADNEPTQPLTALGSWLNQHGMNPKLVLADIKQFYSYTMQLLLVVGAIVVFFARKRLGISTHYLLLVPVGVGLLALQVLVPSIEYGLLRMFQQILFFSAPIIILAGLEILGWYKHLAKTAAILVAGTIGVLWVFLSGMAGAFTGGTNPNLQLANAGFYYDAYYTTSSDQQAFTWIKDNVQTGYPVFSDSFTRFRLRTATGLVTIDGLAPSEITQDSYVVLSGANVTDDRVALYYHGQLLYYTYPREFLEDSKDLIYSSSRNQVWR